MVQRLQPLHHEPMNRELIEPMNREPLNPSLKGRYNMKSESVRHLKCALWLALLLAYVMMFTGAGPARAEICTSSDLADVPMEILLPTAAQVPPILMVVLDNAVSMDYEIMTNENTLNHGFTQTYTSGGNSITQEFDYMLIDPTANNANASIEGTAAVRNAWQSQCSFAPSALTTYDATKLNKMYFNPTVTYSNWPIVANMTDPRRGYLYRDRPGFHHFPYQFPDLGPQGYPTMPRTTRRATMI